MANNYVQGTISPESLKLTDAQVDALAMSVDDIPCKETEKDKHEAWLKETGEAGQLLLRWVSEFGLEYISDIDTEKYGDAWYLYSENGMSEAGDAILQDLLKTLPEDEVPFITYEYASYCSKLRPGEFGGGACFITRDAIEWMSTSNWLHKLSEIQRIGGGGGDVADAADAADVARMVACVNALEGVEDPEAFVMAVRDGHCGQHPADCNLCAVVTGEATGEAKPMTFDELYRAILGVLPEAEMGEDMDDQLLVYTGVVVGEGGEIKPCPTQKKEEKDG